MMIDDGDGDDDDDDYYYYYYYYYYDYDYDGDHDAWNLHELFPTLMLSVGLCPDALSPQLRPSDGILDAWMFSLVGQMMFCQ